MQTINSAEVITGRQFPLAGTYLGTLINVAEPTEDLADWYQWNQARMAAHSARYTVITSDSTDMLEFNRLDGSLMTDIYASPQIGIKRHIPVMAQHIARDTAIKMEALGIQPELRPIWLPLGQHALRQVQVIY